ncbi:hypothetical protein BH10ACT11_BH10ACT11_12380 [soil metagenome]
MSRKSKVVGVIAIAVVACTGSLALAAKTSPRNGNFETGSLKGWHTFTSMDSSGTGWYSYKKGDHAGDGVEITPPPRRRGSQAPKSLYAPPQGKYAAYGFGTGGGPRILYRTLHLKSGKKIALSMDVFYKNFANKFIAPNTLDSHAAKGNQQYRIDLIKKGADLDSLKDKDVIKNIFRTKKGDKLKRKPFKVSKDLSSLAGQTVTLRLAETDTEFFFYPGVDAVKLKQTKKH